MDRFININQILEKYNRNDRSIHDKTSVKLIDLFLEDRIQNRKLGMTNRIILRAFSIDILAAVANI